MATKKKMLQAAAGQASGGAGGAALDITDVFSTYLYEGTSASKTITNGLDLGGEGGLVWIKKRNESTNSDHMLYDTERGPNERLFSNDIGRSYTRTDQLNSFDSDGFTLGADSPASPNTLGKEYVSWSFRKAPKFFDVVTYTGDGNDNRTVSHNLGSSPGMVIVKRTSGADSWMVLHRSLSSNNLLLNLTVAASSLRIKAMDSTTFTLNTNAQVNGSGESYVAYVFAHNDGDGEFGPDGDQDIIKCGSYTGTGGSFAQEITLGFEPQWVLIKRTDSTSDWWLDDSMRGDKLLQPNDSQGDIGADFVQPTATGFKPGYPNQSGQEYIYMAIRRGPLAQPESATEVFAPTYPYSVNGNITAYLGNPTDAVFQGLTGGGNAAFPVVRSRLTAGNRLTTSSSAAEVADATSFWDNMFGFHPAGETGSTNTNTIYWNFRRAPGFFDVVAYTGDGVAGRTVSHNLGVAPEMMWVKSRTEIKNWIVYHKDLTDNTKYIDLNNTGGESTATTAWNSTSPTETVFTVGTATSVNNPNQDFIAYLFATVPGVSKVGSYTGDGTNGRVIDCGFSNGARFVLVKLTNYSGGWFLWDSERGIVSGNDPYLQLNSTNAENNTTDEIDPHSSGFIVNSTGGLTNANGAHHIFYAIA